jgi:hypothetical protein
MVGCNISKTSIRWWPKPYLVPTRRVRYDHDGVKGAKLTVEECYKSYQVKNSRQNYKEIVEARFANNSQTCVKTKGNHDPA